jgi:hypothetical protein
MPAKLTTTIKNIMSIPSSTNAELVNEFYEFMKIKWFILHKKYLRFKNVSV